ncbi:single-stranded DNA-binding protein [Gloeothece verrucosa]|uniref:Single-stranded DNA-binding protein n=1 Tax=Gloeothece verrucosa (strain PCC 7822) TaxID=497965 RepID=E0UNI7_GLOV7|nr:single-stranded DNA-binding protein [Gloeothece verrucosa]ADN18517.1 single-strand binding protein [Gloeothece verrucosa PCC 7822]
MTTSINFISLVGRASKDPEIKYFHSGACVTKLDIAVKRGKDDEPDWFSLEFWDKTAEVAANYVRKGGLIGVQGEVIINFWNDEQGNYRYKPVVRVNNLELLASAKQDTPVAPPNNANSNIPIPTPVKTKAKINPNNN